jgi:hypothetical protein
MGYWLSFNRIAGPIVLLLALVMRSEGVDGAEPKAAERQPPAPAVKTGFRGVLFNPNVQHAQMAGYPWPVFDPYDEKYRTQIRTALRELATEANINFIDLFIPIPFTLARPAQTPRPGQPITEWANTKYLDNVALFVGDCHEAGISIEFDLADNRWIPFSVDSKNHLGRPGSTCWPVAGDAPWDESATWYSQVIHYVESRAKHPESIAMWCMMGHYQLGTAEPDLWGNEGNPAISAYTEKFVKNVWPVFRSAGKRPKAAPIIIPLFTNQGPYWASRSPEFRLCAFRNLKKWLVDDLRLPPDYWIMTTYPYCDPAPDGFYYLRRIVEILGKENASRLISTDFKGPGHNKELHESIITDQKRPGREMLEWHFKKCAEYGMAGWWIYAYQDQEVFNQPMGIRRSDGKWKPDLLEVVRQQAKQ